MTARAIVRAGRGDQRTVVRWIGHMETIPIIRPRSRIINMTVHAVAAAGRNTGLQGRNSRMAEAAGAVMGDIHRRVGGGSRIVTVKTEGRPAGHIIKGHVIDIAVNGQFLVRMAVQAMDRSRC